MSELHTRQGSSSGLWALGSMAAMGAGYGGVRLATAVRRQACDGDGRLVATAVQHVRATDNVPPQPTNQPRCPHNGQRAPPQGLGHCLGHCSSRTAARTASDRQHVPQRFMRCTAVRLREPTTGPPRASCSFCRKRASAMSAAARFARERPSATAPAWAGSKRPARAPQPCIPPGPTSTCLRTQVSIVSSVGCLLLVLWFVAWLYKKRVIIF